MEVDDAVSSPLAKKGAQNGEAPGKISCMAAALSKTEEEPPGSLRESTPLSTSSEHDDLEEDMEIDESDEKISLFSPLKLQVSYDEDSQDGVALASGEQKIMQNRARNQKAMSFVSEEDEENTEHADETDGGSVSLKRKRYEVRRSGSEECLLGFDEQSGEAELVKDDVDVMLKIATEKSISCDKMHTYTDLDIASQSVAKKSKQNIGAKQTTEMKISSAMSSPPLSLSLTGAQETDEIENSRIVVESPNNNVELSQSTPPTTESTNPETTAVASDGNKKPLSPQDDYYKKPFEYGWKRELVWRANMETSKDKADVYFITPSGKKLRARSDIIPLLEGDLTIDHFSFAREPLGGGAEFEIVRSAKPTSRISITAATLAAAPAPTNIGKRISKPKGPKGASPPPQGWTPTRALKVNNAALLSGGGRHGSGGNINAITPPIHRGGGSTAGSAHKSSKSAKKYGSRVLAATVTGGQATASSGESSGAIHEPCTIMCPHAQGEVPQLQCVKCFCLYHHECVGLNLQNCEYRLVTGNTGSSGSIVLGERDYVCEACQPKTEKSLAKTPIRNLPSSPAARSARPDKKLPQTIAVVKGKKYIMVSKPRRGPRKPPNTHVNDIENDLKQIKESISNIRKPSSATFDAASMGRSTPPAVASTNSTDQSNKLFATNFFANVSFAYDALLCILKYLKIHERPRAASVCKLWHLAAKDMSLWHTVRMKNSKVCNWSGFAAALRRGETKHLDLRKMLLASTRSDEMWQDFSEYIGTVYSLEVIDLCRCSARVVENLFQSNKNLRVLNAIAINDESINLEHIGQLQKLEELRLRTCEMGTLTGDGLKPLKALKKLAHISLTAIRSLGVKYGLEVLGDLSGLRSLELGECGSFDNTFAEVVLPKLVHLQRLRLENGHETGCCTLKILETIAQLKQLTQLELVNFDIKPGFNERLSQCTSIRKLLIIPTYISQSATTNHIVLSAVQQVADTLRVFTWGVTVELLRVTALYVDQCEESTKKQKHHFDECIPVLKPVPGSPTSSEELKTNAPDKDRTAESLKHADEDSSEMPQIEILPLDKVESILGKHLPNTKYTIVKVPYHVTCKQQLVE